MSCRWAEARKGYFADLQGQCCSIVSYQSSSSLHWTTSEFRRNHGKGFEASDQLCSLKVGITKLVYLYTFEVIVLFSPRGGQNVS